MNKQLLGAPPREKLSRLMAINCERRIRQDTKALQTFILLHSSLISTVGITLYRPVNSQERQLHEIGRLVVQNYGILDVVVVGLGRKYAEGRQDGLELAAVRVAVVEDADVELRLVRQARDPVLVGGTAFHGPQSGGIFHERKADLIIRVDGVLDVGLKASMSAFTKAQTTYIRRTVQIVNFHDRAEDFRLIPVAKHTPGRPDAFGICIRGRKEAKDDCNQEQKHRRLPGRRTKPAQFAENR